MRKLAIKLVVLIHALFAAAIFACLPIVLIYPRSHKTILFFIGAVLISQIPYRACVLTKIENALRGEEKYHGTFMSHYLETVFHVHVSDKVINIFSAVYFVTAILVAIFYRLNQAF